MVSSSVRKVYHGVATQTQIMGRSCWGTDECEVGGKDRSGTLAERGIRGRFSKSLDHSHVLRTTE